MKITRFLLALLALALCAGCGTSRSGGGGGGGSGTAEICDDGIDNDGDGTVDEGDDNDGDGFWTCGTEDIDCDDTNAEVHPAAGESCDGLDSDCDGDIPADEADSDGDGCMVCEGDPDDSNPDDCEGSGDDDDTPDDDDDDIVTDTDGDGYTDHDEELAGTDPADADSVIYQGGWPFNPNKDQLSNPGWDSQAGVGAMLPRLQAVDQYGDLVDLYDFAGQGRPIILHQGTIWSSPDRGLAAYLSSGDPSHVEDFAWWDPAYGGLYGLIQNQEIYWLTVLFSTGSKGPATQEDCANWHAAYPNDFIPVLADSDLQLYDWIGVTAYPVLNLANEGLILQIYQEGGPFEVLAEVPNLP